jgi:site-specific recombinase XerC
MPRFLTALTIPSPRHSNLHSDSIFSFMQSPQQESRGSPSFIQHERRLRVHSLASVAGTLRTFIDYWKARGRLKSSPLHTIRAWLGHVSIDTTNIYAESDLEMKAKALGMCETKLRQPRRRWRDNPDLLKFLAQL